MRIHVLCFGNLLQGDDGFGIHLYQRAMTMAWPADVFFFDCGILGFGAINYFENCDQVVIVDAMNFKIDEGQLHWLKIEDLAQPLEKFSMHAIDLTHLFYTIPIIIPENQRPKIDILAIEIKKCDVFCETLSRIIESSLDLALLRLKQFIDDVKKEDFCENRTTDPC